jgi:tetratricopeptide (TPR) repeat protein
MCMTGFWIFPAIIERFLFMFLQGEKISNIKSSCFVDFADHLHRKKNISKAIEYYDKAIGLNLENTRAYEGIVMSLIVHKSFNQALETCEKAISIRPSSLLYILQSIIYECLGQPALSDEAFHKTLKFYDNDKSIAYDRLAYFYWLLNIFEQAEYYCKKALKLNPDEPSFHYHLASIYSANQQYEMAIEEYERVLKLTSDKKYRKNSQKEIKGITRLLKTKHM